MNQLFNYYEQAEIPTLTLCNPNKSSMYSLALASQIKNTVRYNAISELTFDYPQSGDSGETINPAYEYIKGKMLVLIEGVGYYIIGNAPEDLDGSIPIKHVTAMSQIGRAHV